MVPGDRKATARGSWVFLQHRLPREPSSPRIALWRALRRLGAISISDGLAALPAAARTIEHFEWLASGINDDGGNASVWVARPTNPATARRLMNESMASIEAEYAQIVAAAGTARAGGDEERRRSLRQLRSELRRVATRDYFRAAGGIEAAAAVEALAHAEVEA